MRRNLKKQRLEEKDVETSVMVITLLAVKPDTTASKNHNIHHKMVSYITEYDLPPHGHIHTHTPILGTVGS